jgi:cytochrome c-type biogenesis protein CcmH/NrfF
LNGLAFLRISKMRLPLWLAIVCGMAGAIIGSASYYTRFVNHGPGIDWLRWLITVVVTTILVVIANAIVARSRAKREGIGAKASIALSTRNNLPLWLAIVCGMAGAIIGSASYYTRFVNHGPGIDWLRWLITVVVTTILVVIANAIVARSRAKREAEEQAEEQAQREAQERGTRETGVQRPQLRQPKIFLCYRRKDTEGFARGIYDRLADKYGHEQVYRDIDSTPAGVKYSTWIESRVRQCSVMVVLIGNAWISAQDRTGQRRLDSPKDWVRHEIKAALKRDIPIIPVLLQRAPMPSEDELPPSIADLAGFQSAEITDTRWDFDVGQLIRAIDDLIAPV